MRGVTRDVIMVMETNANMGKKRRTQPEMGTTIRTSETAIVMVKEDILARGSSSRIAVEEITTTVTIISKDRKVVNKAVTIAVEVVTIDEEETKVVDPEVATAIMVHQVDTRVLMITVLDRVSTAHQINKVVLQWS